MKKQLLSLVVLATLCQTTESVQMNEYNKMKNWTTEEHEPHSYSTSSSTSVVVNNGNVTSSNSSNMECVNGECTKQICHEGVCHNSTHSLSEADQDKMIEDIEKEQEEFAKEVSDMFG